MHPGIHPVMVMALLVPQVASSGAERAAAVAAQENLVARDSTTLAPGAAEVLVCFGDVRLRLDNVTKLSAKDAVKVARQLAASRAGSRCLA